MGKGNPTYGGGEHMEKGSLWGRGDWERRAHAHRAGEHKKHLTHEEGVSGHHSRVREYFLEEVALRRVGRVRRQ